MTARRKARGGRLRFRSVAAYLAATKAAGMTVMLFGETKDGRPALQFDDKGRTAAGGTSRRALALMWWGRDHQADVEAHLIRYPLAGVGSRRVRDAAKRNGAGFIPGIVRSANGDDRPPAA